MNDLDSIIARALSNAMESSATVIKLVSEAYRDHGPTLTDDQKGALAMKLARHAIVLADAFSALIMASQYEAEGTPALTLKNALGLN